MCKEYPYVEDGLVWFSDDWIVGQFSYVKWNGRNKARYVSLGYNFTQMTDIFQVDVRDLFKKSKSDVLAICPICGYKKDVRFSDMTKYKHSKCLNCVHVNDLTSCIFGRLLVIKQVEIRGKRGSRWLCICECGRDVVVSGQSLCSGNTRSCGCLRVYDMDGDVYGRLKVVEFYDIIGGDAVWSCICECGNTTNVRAASLKVGDTTSCGCLASELASDRISGTNNPHWDETLTDEERASFRDNTVHIWAKTIKELDKYICQICSDDRGDNLVSHHLNGYKDFPEQRTDLNNGVAICEDCHKEFHKYMGNNRVKCTVDDFIQFCEEFYPNAMYLEKYHKQQ